MTQHILLRDLDIPDIGKLEVYVKHGGYGALRQALTAMTPDQVIDEVKASGLRGRGGAGFPTGVKWSFVPKDRFPHYVTVNADESEPGTFKDRELMEFNPHQVIEGAAIAAYAVGATRVYHYLRGEFKPVARRLQAAIDEAYAAGYLGQNVFGTNVEIQMFVHLGAGAYICGEESALLESLEGKRGQPRLRPPFPAVVGLYGQPTVINNTETMANVPYILNNGADGLQETRHREKPGHQDLLSVGHGQAPRQLRSRVGQDHLPRFDLRRRFRAGHDDGRPQGQSDLAVGRLRSDRDGARPSTCRSITNRWCRAGSILGSASVIVMDDSIDMVWAAGKVMHFFRHESCGKCTPCREGTFWMEKQYHRILGGKAHAGRCAAAAKRGESDASASACARWANLPPARCCRASSIFRPSTRRARRMPRSRSAKPAAASRQSAAAKIVTAVQDSA